MDTANHQSNFELSHADIIHFISIYDSNYGGKLSNVINYSRVVSLAHFAALVSHAGIQEQVHTGIISGSENDPELAFLNSKKLTILNFESDNSYDLDKSWINEPSKNFSITFSNQVLEHVFNPHVAFKNIIHHTAKGGYIWVSIPTINCIHGEPYFYSSGFHPRFLERLGIENNLEILHIGAWGSYKYMIGALSGDWFSASGLLPSATKNYLHPELVKVDGTIRDNNITDCWALFRKP
jgi:hypothetical protein